MTQRSGKTLEDAARLVIGLDNDIVYISKMKVKDRETGVAMDVGLSWSGDQTFDPRGTSRPVDVPRDSEEYQEGIERIKQQLDRIQAEF